MRLLVMNYYDDCVECIEVAQAAGNEGLNFSDFIMNKHGKTRSEIVQDNDAIETAAKKACKDKRLKVFFPKQSNGWVGAKIL